MFVVDADELEPDEDIVLFLVVVELMTAWSLSKCSKNWSIYIKVRCENNSLQAGTNIVNNKDNYGCCFVASQLTNLDFCCSFPSFFSEYFTRVSIQINIL